MTPGQIRNVALCVFRHGPCILVGQGYDDVKAEAFHRPLGGGVEFGEPGWGGAARWLDLGGTTRVPLYPDGLAALLRRTPPS